MRHHISPRVRAVTICDTTFKKIYIGVVLSQLELSHGILVDDGAHRVVRQEDVGCCVLTTPCAGDDLLNVLLITALRGIHHRVGKRVSCLTMLT